MCGDVDNHNSFVGTYMTAALLWVHTRLKYGERMRHTEDKKEGNLRHTEY